MKQKTTVSVLAGSFLALATMVAPAVHAGPTPAFGEATFGEATGADVTPALRDVAADARVVSFSALGAPSQFDGLSAYESLESGGTSGMDPAPMIPLPPAVWAGLITFAGVALHTVRQQRPARARR